MDPKSARSNDNAPIEQTVRSLAELHAERERQLHPAQKRIEWLTARIGRPWFAYALISFIVLWVVVDRSSGHPFNSGSFSLLQLILSIMSVLIAVSILITENRQGDIADQRAKVTLQIALINEQKTAKIIELLAQQRKDSPHLPDREDKVAEHMAEATDLRTAIEKLEEAEGAESGSI
ncbi:MAG: DUF1003 domain-containing protein [Candidatus Aquilonibacter sp.]